MDEFNEASDVSGSQPKEHQELIIQQEHAQQQSDYQSQSSISLSQISNERVNSPPLQHKISRSQTIKQANTSLMRQQTLREKVPVVSVTEQLISVLDKTKKPYKKTNGVFQAHGETMIFDRRSLFLFDEDNLARKIAVWLVTWYWFKTFILLVIIFNSVTIGMEDKEFRVNADIEKTTLADFVEISGKVCSIIFLVEFVLKVLAMGFVKHKNSYLRDYWNAIDFVIVMISILELTSSQEDGKEGGGNFTLIRMLRLFKPLRSLNALGSLKFMIATLLRSLHGLLNVLIFLSFFLSIFAVLGVNLFRGNQYRACRSTPDVIYPEDGSAPYWPMIEDVNQLCHNDEQCREFTQNEETWCGSIWEKAGLSPLEYDNVRENELILYGIPGFDNYFQGLYTVFQVCTRESWVYLMHNFSQSNQNENLSYIFFTSIILFGSWFVINLILAHILDAFNHQQTAQSEYNMQKAEKDRIEFELMAQEEKMKHEINKSVSQMAADIVNVQSQQNSDQNIIKFQATKVEKSTDRRKSAFAKVRADSKMIYLDNMDQGNKASKSIELELPDIFMRRSMVASIKEQDYIPNAVQEIVQEIEQNNPFAGTELPKSSLADQANPFDQEDLNLDNPFEEVKRPRSVANFKKRTQSFDSNAVSREGTKIFSNKKLTAGDGDDSPLKITFDLRKSKTYIEKLQQLPGRRKFEQNDKPENSPIEEVSQSISDKASINFYERGDRIDEQSEISSHSDPAKEAEQEPKEASPKIDKISSLVISSYEEEKDQDGGLPQLVFQDQEEDLDLEINETAAKNANQSQTAFLDHSDAQVMKQQTNRIEKVETERSIQYEQNQEENYVDDTQRNILLKSHGPQNIESNLPENQADTFHEEFKSSVQEEAKEKGQDDVKFTKMRTSVNFTIFESDNTVGTDLLCTQHEQKRQFQLEQESQHHAEQSKINSFFHQMVNGLTFKLVMFVFIIANTVTMALYTYEQTQEEKEIIKILDIIFDSVFLLEMICKLLGLGFRNYWKDAWNVFDAVIVISSIINLATTLALSDQLEELQAVFTAFQVARLMRIMKIARYFHGIQVMLRKTKKSISEIGPFTLLLFLFTYLFALIGRELFAYKARLGPDGEFIYGEDAFRDLDDYQEIRYPRINFNTLSDSITAITILINGEDWVWVAQDWIRAYGSGDTGNEIIASIFFVIVMIFGNMTLFTLFTGIILHNFKKLERASIKAQNKTYLLFLRQTTQKVINIFQSRQKAFGEESTVKESGEENKIEVDIDDFMNRSSESSESQEGNCFDTQELDKAQVGQGKHQKSKTDIIDNAQMDMEYSIYKEEKSEKNIKSILENNIPLQGKSCGLFSPENKFRRLCSSISQHWLFGLFVIVLILATTVFLAMETPLQDPNSQHKKNLQKIDRVITVLFLLEALLKIVTQGFAFNGKNSYLRSPWNCLDFFIVISSCVESALFMIEASTSTFKILRVIRLLRPIRLVARNGSLKSAITSLIKSVPKIFELLSLVVLIVFIVGMLETYLFSGKFNYCYIAHLDMSVVESQKLIIHKWDCLNYGGEWVKPDLNFDSIGQAMLGLSSIQSHEGWIDMMWASVDASEIDYAPIENNNFLLFVPFTLIVIFFIVLLFLNLFVGVVIETFNNQKEILTNNHVLSAVMRTYLYTMLMTFTVKPRKVLNSKNSVWFRRMCIDLAQSIRFEYFILTVILMNTCVLAAYYNEMSEQYEMVLEILNFIFMGIFTLEALIKIIAHKKAYFNDAWNIFDFIIIISAILIMIVMNFGFLSEIKGLTTAIRVLRVARMLRLFVKAKKLQIIFHTLVEVGPTLSSLGFLLLLSIYMFSIIGIQLFAMIDLRKIPGVETELNQTSNFQNFFNAFMTLLRCATGENWNQIMFECGKSHDILYQCHEDETYESIVEAGRDPANWDGPHGCGSGFNSFVFHLIYQIVITQIFLNLFIAIIIDAFMGVTEVYHLPVSRIAVIEFEEIWSKNCDEKEIYFMDIRRLDNFLYQLSVSTYADQLLVVPYFVKESSTYREAVIKQLEIPTYDNHKKIMFYDTLQKLAVRVARLSHIKGILQENQYKIRVLEKIGGINPMSFVKQQEIANVQTDLHNHFEGMVEKISQLSSRIELVSQLRKKKKVLQRKYGSKVDTNDKFITSCKIGDIKSQKLGARRIYTTKHYIAAKTILRFWKSYLLSKEMLGDIFMNSSQEREKSESGNSSCQSGVQVVQQDLSQELPES